MKDTHSDSPGSHTLVTFDTKGERLAAEFITRFLPRSIQRGLFS